ncbi:conserved hypothetical protein [Thermoanaerobacter mathranii subsp. mathranii str. A3]|uniref:Cytoskeleton protein RodZ-like C-terminal domain-containing protein n=3 Tax=Thermoanaerobacter TaxID=1754 RepID=D3T3T7_THEIA|nr:MULTISPECIES: helix-turn-helix domain-containing protein [Thermoanaerobacter]ADD02889.1 conserved hypothetical protein [Thermoanaerobacter italicus Ab9]ADH61335.1 conserved hypothetical protein [Thermoanaerobacter mathranii subsp. mathranii str. A3]MDP9750483.1 cytoskeletal protein RodZ [Thermoanaerobacter pentosaceus]
MKELGEFLKNERIKKGLTLEEIQEITKIRIRYLKAIEDGDFSIMPALVYAKGFVKSYAEALGLDGNELVKKYEYLFQEKEEETLPNIETNSSYKKEGRDFSQFFLTLKKAVIFVLVIGIIGYGFYYFINQVKKGLAPIPQQNQSEASTYSEDKTDLENKTNPSQESNVSQPKVNTSIEKISETSKKIEYKVVPSGESYKVEISVPGEKCWFSIKVDENVVFEGLMTKDMSKIFDVKDSITILMGYPPAVKITVDGEELPTVQTPSPVTINIHT